MSFGHFNIFGQELPHSQHKAIFPSKLEDARNTLLLECSLSERDAECRTAAFLTWVTGAPRNNGESGADGQAGGSAIGGTGPSLQGMPASASLSAHDRVQSSLARPFSLTPFAPTLLFPSSPSGADKLPSSTLPWPPAAFLAV